MLVCVDNLKRVYFYKLPCPTWQRLTWGNMASQLTLMRLVRLFQFLTGQIIIIIICFKQALLIHQCVSHIFPKHSSVISQDDFKVDNCKEIYKQLSTPEEYAGIQVIILFFLIFAFFI